MEEMFRITQAITCVFLALYIEPMIMDTGDTTPVYGMGGKFKTLNNEVMFQDKDEVTQDPDMVAMFQCTDNVTPAPGMVVIFRGTYVVFLVPDIVVMFQ